MTQIIGNEREMKIIMFIQLSIHIKILQKNI